MYLNDIRLTEQLIDNHTICTGLSIYDAIMYSTPSYAAFVFPLAVDRSFQANTFITKAGQGACVSV